MSRLIEILFTVFVFIMGIMLGLVLGAAVVDRTYQKIAIQAGVGTYVLTTNIPPKSRFEFITNSANLRKP